MAEKKLSGLARQSGIYALGNAAAKLSGLVLAPLYLNTDYLSKEGFGYFALLIVTAQLGIFVAGLGLGTGLLKFMSGPEHAAERKALPFTALIATVGAAALAFGLIWFGDEVLAQLLLDGPQQRYLVRILAVYVAFKVVGAIPMMLLRIEERAGWYAFAMTAEIGVLIGGVYYFLVAREMGLEGIMLAYALSAGVSMVVLTGVMLSVVSWTFRARLMRPLMRYGAPLVLASLAGWFLNAGDRYLLRWLDNDSLPIYEWAARISGVLNMLFVQSFQLAFSVLGLKALGVGDVSLYRRTFRHYVIWTGWAVLGLSLITFDAMVVLVEFGADPDYLEADRLVLPLALGFMAYGIYVVVNNVLYATSHTKVIGLNVALAAVLNAGLNIALIPVLGALGAALTTLFSYAVLAGLSARVAAGKVHVNYDGRVLFVVLLLVVGLYGLMWPSRDWSMALRLPLRLTAILAYLPLLVAFRLYSWEEVRLGWRHAKAQWARLRG